MKSPETGQPRTSEVQHREILQSCLENEAAVLYLSQNYKKEGWGNAEKKKGGINILKKDCGGKAYGYMARCRVFAAPEMIMAAIHDAGVAAPEFKELLHVMEWDESTETSESPGTERSCVVVEWVDPRVKIPLLIPVSKRDFVVATHSAMKRDTCGDGVDIYVVSSMSVRFEGCKPRKGFVRGQSKTSGWVIKPIASDPPECGVTWISITDPCGNIPKQVVAMGGSIASQSLARVKSSSEGWSRIGKEVSAWQVDGTPLSRHRDPANETARRPHACRVRAERKKAPLK